jgi:hypothetical protein
LDRTTEFENWIEDRRLRSAGHEQTLGEDLDYRAERANGRMLRGLDRKEFAFEGEEGYTAPPVQAAPKPVGQAAEPMPKMEGAISSESILEKLS